LIILLFYFFIKNLNKITNIYQLKYLFGLYTFKTVIETVPTIVSDSATTSSGGKKLYERRLSKRISKKRNKKSIKKRNKKSIKKRNKKSIKKRIKIKHSNK